jgi:hypothetical protein
MPPTKTNFRATFSTEDVVSRRGDDVPFLSSAALEAPFLANALLSRATEHVTLAMLAHPEVLDELTAWEEPFGTSRITGGLIVFEPSVEDRVRRSSEGEEFDPRLIRDDDLLP